MEWKRQLPGEMRVVRLSSCRFLFGRVEGGSVVGHGGRWRQFLYPCFSFEFVLGWIYHWFLILTPHWIRLTSYTLFRHQEQTGSETSGCLYLLEGKTVKENPNTNGLPKDCSLAPIPSHSLKSWKTHISCKSVLRPKLSLGFLSSFFLGMSWKLERSKSALPRK